MLGNVLVLDFGCFFNIHSFQDLCCVGAACDCRSAAKRLEYCLFDFTCVFIDLDLQLHDVTACRCSDESSADTRILLVQRADIAWVLVVVNHVLVVSKASLRELNHGAHSCSVAHGLRHQESSRCDRKSGHHQRPGLRLFE